MLKVLFVCTGNICRSPTAAAILSQRARQAGLAGRIEADSAGAHAIRAGERPDPRSVAVAREHGVALADRPARQVSPEDFARFDLIVAMETRHVRHLLKLCPAGLEARIRLLMSYVPDSLVLDVPDPFVGAASFGEVYRMIELGVGHLFDNLRHMLRD
jgi:protein-tyrosine phosphatase